MNSFPERPNLEETLVRLRGFLEELCDMGLLRAEYYACGKRAMPCLQGV